jgi:hypothetical protein
MRLAQPARVHLALLDGGGCPQGISGSPAVRVWLGPGEWALMPGGRSRPLAPSVIRGVLRRLELSDAHRSGARYQITRVQPAVMVPWFSQALLHHTASRTVLYCRSDQIAPHAADCLAALATRTAEVVGSAAAQGSCQVSVARVRHCDLPAGLHPAVTTARGAQITAHVCSRLITHELTAAVNAIGAGLSPLTPAAATRRPRRALEPRPLALCAPTATGLA